MFNKQIGDDTDMSMGSLQFDNYIGNRSQYVTLEYVH